MNTTESTGNLVNQTAGRSPHIAERQRNVIRHWQVITLVLLAVFVMPAAWCQAQHDYFLEAVSNDVRHCISPDGGQLGNLQPEHTVVQYWNVPEVVLPGETIYSSIGYAWTNNIGQGSVVYKTVLAEWQPNNPIVVLENGEIQGNPREIRKDFTFTAPTTPGAYRMRLAMTWAYQGIQHFYGDGPAGDVNNPGVGHFCEVQFRVEGPPQRDYFLEAVSNNVGHCISPDGGKLGNLQPEQTVVQYWNIPRVVMPGQIVHSSIGYAWTNNIGQGSVVYKTVLGEWQPCGPIAVLENGEGQGSPRAIRKDFTFTAPTTPGTYRMRLAMTWAFQGIQCFYGDGPAGDAFKPGVGHFCEVLLRVENPPQRDYFLEAVSNNVRECISPDGGKLGNLQPEHTVAQYWNIPKVVLPGQTVYSSLSYAWTDNIGQGSIVYKTVLAEWQPNSPIATLENGEGQGSPREVRKDFVFTAPTTPGIYRMRLAMTWAFQGVQHFYGDGPAGDAFNPGVGHWAEVTITVAPSYVLDLKMFAGLILAGAPGNYRIEYIPALGGTNTWQTLTNVTLTTSPSVFFDLDSPSQPKRFYRASPLP